MKHRAFTGFVASSVGLLLTLGFACVDADIPRVSNRLRDGVAEVYGNAGAPPTAGGSGGSAAAPLAGAGGAGDSAEDPGDDPSGGAAGSSMAAAGAGGAGGDDAAGGAGGEEPPPGDVCDGFAVLQEGCSGTACHSEPNAPLGNFAYTEEAALEFIGRAGAVSCAGQGTIIDPDNPADSLLIQKMSGDAPCGTTMPPAGALPQEDIDCVEEWIGSL